MKSPKSTATAIVSAAFFFGTISFVDAELPKGLRSQAHPAPIAWNHEWDEDDANQENRSENSFATQRRHEELELQRRLDGAAHLRQINEQTGNPQLINIAERMEQRAIEHYKQQLDRINERERRAQQPVTLATGQDTPPGSPLVSILKPQPNEVSSVPTSVGNPQPTPAIPLPASEIIPLPPPPTPAIPPKSSTAGRTALTDNVQQRLVNEQKLLQQRLAAADRLRQLASKGNNKHLLETADFTEQRAWEQFDRRVQSLLNPPGSQAIPRPHRQRLVTDAFEQTMDEPESDINEIERPVRRMLRGVRNALGL